jgi:hypothetical protein
MITIMSDLMKHLVLYHPWNIHSKTTF